MTLERVAGQVWSHGGATDAVAMVELAEGVGGGSVENRGGRPAVVDRRRRRQRLGETQKEEKMLRRRKIFEDPP